MVTQQRLKEVLDYDEHTGVFTWREDRSRVARAGMPAGHRHSRGYVRIVLDGRVYEAHRLAFLWMVGSIPKFVDHVNRVRDDNRMANLRAATKAQNGANRSKQTGKYHSKFKGVTRSQNKWQAQIGGCKGTDFLGRFETEADAAHAYNQAALERFGRFALLNEVANA